jgi:nitroreductase/NAD-dependent dihydropyrimidine dehydrogenase PreA subunit
MQTLHHVDSERCNGDGICTDVCPEDVLDIVDGRAVTIADRAGACIFCGQCVAVCPREALSMPALPDDMFPELGGGTVAYEDLYAFLARRRSVRRFRDTPVSRGTVERILDAAATAPMGMPPHSTEVLVFQERDERAFLLDNVVREYDAMLKGYSNPVGRAMIRLAAGGEQYRTLRDYIVDIARRANAQYREDATDQYMYHAPAFLLFHADRHAMSYVENAHLVCHHAMLAAHSLGLGSTIIGLVPPVVDRSKRLREHFEIPKENKVITSLVLGYPRFRFHRRIRRSLADIRWK